MVPSDKYIGGGGGFSGWRIVALETVVAFWMRIERRTERRQMCYELNAVDK